MKRFNNPVELILEREPSQKGMDNVEKLLAAEGIAIEPLTEASVSKSMGSGSKKLKEKVSLKTTVSDLEINPWDVAHLSVKALGKKASYIEPDTWNEFVVDRKVADKVDNLSSKSFGSGTTSDDFDSDWVPLENRVWHLDDNHSQLLSARKAVANINYPVRIGHLDTGYSNHKVIPASIKDNPLQRNFIAGENPARAFDIQSEGILKQPGHGTGTLGILAGAKVNLNTNKGVFNDYLGGAYFADVVCCRVSKTVILLKTSSFSDALDYLTRLTLSGTPVHVVSMSMGGAPSKSWADAVNRAYMAGITVVTAAGNNINGLPTRHVVYPARFGRVIAACGVTYDFAPYYTKLKKEMQGNFGPARHMEKALAAFTPNTPWASVESGTIRFSGAGTSSATPQIAAAAAIYYRKYHQELDRLKPWQRVEAIRNALYSSALKKVKKGFDSYETYFGNGILQANDALKIPVAANLPITEEDSVPWFPILDTIFKAVPDAEQEARLEMFNTELAQLVFTHPELSSILDDDRREYDKIGKAKWNKFVKSVIDHPETSVTLRKFLLEKYKSK